MVELLRASQFTNQQYIFQSVVVSLGEGEKSRHGFSTVGFDYLPPEPFCGGVMPRPLSVDEECCMPNLKVSEDQLVERFKALAPWSPEGDFGEAEWGSYLDAARVVQEADPATVEAALIRFLAGAGDEADADESKVFILMRVVFDLPEQSSAESRRSFKGWSNWPEPDTARQVSLSWPVSWRSGNPSLEAPYAGSMGLPYAASQEYRHLRGNFPYRQL